MQYGIVTISTVWKIKLAQNDKQVEVSREREFPQRSQFPGERIGNSFCQARTKTFSANINPLNLSALQPIIQHVVCVLARQTTRRLTAGWWCIFSMLVMAGRKVAFVRTVDSDVVVLSIHHYPTFQNLGLTGLWIDFGCVKNYRDTPVHEVSAQLGPNRCLALPFFHAFTGGDLTTRLFGIRKKLHGMHGCIVQKRQNSWSP